MIRTQRGPYIEIEMSDLSNFEQELGYPRLCPNCGSSLDFEKNHDKHTVILTCKKLGLPCMGPGKRPTFIISDPEAVREWYINDDPHAWGHIGGKIRNLRLYVKSLKLYLEEGDHCALDMCRGNIGSSEHVNVIRKLIAGGFYEPALEYAVDKLADLEAKFKIGGD